MVSSRIAILVACVVVSAMLSACSTDNSPPSTTLRPSPNASSQDRTKAIQAVLKKDDLRNWTAAGEPHTTNALDMEQDIISCAAAPQADYYATADVTGPRLFSPQSDTIPSLNVVSRVRFSETKADVDRNITDFRSEKLQNCVTSKLQSSSSSTTPTSGGSSSPLDPSGGNSPAPTVVPAQIRTTKTASPDGKTDTTAWRTVFSYKNADGVATEGYIDMFGIRIDRAEAFLAISRDKLAPSSNVEQQLLELMRSRLQIALGQ